VKMFEEFGDVNENWKDGEVTTITYSEGHD
jgi:hypothetical protein